MNFEGRLLGNRYEILEKIGIGGMATVYKAKCHVLNRYVAVKILRDEFTTDAEFVRRFNTEAQAAASLTHPNIVSIYDVGNEGNVYYIVMELIQGKTLKEIIIQDGALPWKWSVNVAIQIASALEIAHRNNIIHRDIKPHNIIITEDGVAKVTDFGIAKAVSNSTITAFGTTIGSVHYFSPEHARGGFTDAKSDIYSLGVVMYEMLTGRVPFDADTPVSVALKHMQEEPTEPIKINPLIPEALNKIIMKAMRKDPNLRYQNATEMLRDLKQVSKNPDGNFVVLDNYTNDFPTQKINIVNDRRINEQERRAAQPHKKKGNKLVAFLKKHKVLKFFLIMLICILIFAIAMGVTIVVSNAKRPKQVQIPNLVGKTLQQVEKAVNELNVKYEVVAEEFSTEHEAGKVTKQDPKYASNYKILENSTIKITTSKGVELTKVPKVAGEKKDSAKTMIENAGLKVEIKEEHNDKIEEGYVIKQEPEQETQVAKDSVVTIYVSLGTDKIDVPDVLNKTEEEAKKAIEDAKLKVVVKTGEDTTKSNGVVIKQDVESGTKVTEETTITITINKLPEIKSGKVNINVKALTGYTPPKNPVKNTNTTNTNNTNSTNNTNTTNNTNSSVVNTNNNDTVIAPKKVKVMVKVNDDTVYNESHSEDTENVTVNNVQGIGTVTVKVYIDEVLKTTKTLDLNSENPVLNIN